MPNPIKPKRSYTPSSVPLATDLATHELAVNWNDGKIFTKNAAGSIVTWTLGSGGGGTAEDTLLRSLFVPGAPTSVTASAGNAQASVSWTAPTGVLAQAPVTDYLVQYSSNSGSSWTTFSDGTSATASATVTGLTNGTAYTFRVAAVNGAGQGAWSTASSAVTPQEGDPLFGKVSLLLHMDGSGSTFVDSSKYASTVTAYGNATQSTAQSKWGGKSAYFDGNGDYLSVSSSGVAFGTSDFTIECWAWLNATGSYGSVFSTLENNTGIARGVSLGVMNTGEPYVLFPNGIYIQGGTAIPTGQWVHVALARSSGTATLYINGSSVGAASAPTDCTDTNAVVGRFYNDLDTNYWNGYVDDLRVTKGVSRSISVPTAAYPT